MHRNAHARAVSQAGSPKKGSDDDWTHPQDPDARITQRKDRRTHLAHKAEHAVDMETGAMVAITLQGADEGDTRTIPETVAEAGEHITAVVAYAEDSQAVKQVSAEGPREVVTDQGYHSRQVVSDLSEWGVRTYCLEPHRSGQRWQGQQREQQAVYANRRADSRRTRSPVTTPAQRKTGAVESAFI